MTLTPQDIPSDGASRARSASKSFPLSVANPAAGEVISYDLQLTNREGQAVTESGSLGNISGATQEAFAAALASALSARITVLQLPHLITSAGSVLTIDANASPQTGNGDRLTLLGLFLGPGTELVGELPVTTLILSGGVRARGLDPEAVEPAALRASVTPELVAPALTIPVSGGGEPVPFTDWDQFRAQAPQLSAAEVAARMGVVAPGTIWTELLVAMLAQPPGVIGQRGPFGSREDYLLHDAGSAIFAGRSAECWARNFDFSGTAFYGTGAGSGFNFEQRHHLVGDRVFIAAAHWAGGLDTVKTYVDRNGVSHTRTVDRIATLQLAGQSHGVYETITVGAATDIVIGTYTQELPASVSRYAIDSTLPAVGELVLATRSRRSSQQRESANSTTPPTRIQFHQAASSPQTQQAYALPNTNQFPLGNILSLFSDAADDGDSSDGLFRYDEAAGRLALIGCYQTSSRSPRVGAPAFLQHMIDWLDEQGLSFDTIL